MSTSSLTAGVLAGLTGEAAPPTSSSSSGTTRPTETISSAGSPEMSAELRFASVNWERKKRVPTADPRRSVDVPLTVEDRFLAVPWEPSEAPVAQARPPLSEEDEQSAEERARELSVGEFFKKASW